MFFKDVLQVCLSIRLSATVHAISAFIWRMLVSRQIKIGKNLVFHCNTCVNARPDPIFPDLVLLIPLISCNIAYLSLEMNYL